MKGMKQKKKRREHFISEGEDEGEGRMRRGTINVVYWISYGKFALQNFFFFCTITKKKEKEQKTHTNGKEASSKKWSLI